MKLHSSATVPQLNACFRNVSPCCLITIIVCFVLFFSLSLSFFHRVHVTPSTLRGVDSHARSRGGLSHKVLRSQIHNREARKAGWGRQGVSARRDSLSEPSNLCVCVREVFREKAHRRG